MEILPSDVIMADTKTPPNSLLAVSEPHDSCPGCEHSVNSESMPETFTNLQAELTLYASGDTASRANYNENVATVPHFDPRALLNPKSPTSKRPASSGGDAERGRTDPTIAGQVSLVERLHNVQERTASPAKRVKTDEERKRVHNASNFSSSSTLDLQRQNGRLPTQPGPAIDLTMSECPCFQIS